MPTRVMAQHRSGDWSGRLRLLPLASDMGIYNAKVELPWNLAAHGITTRWPGDGATFSPLPHPLTPRRLHIFLMASSHLGFSRPLPQARNLLTQPSVVTGC